MNGRKIPPRRVVDGGMAGSLVVASGSAQWPPGSAGRGRQRQRVGTFLTRWALLGQGKSSGGLAGFGWVWLRIEGCGLWVVGCGLSGHSRLSHAKGGASRTEQDWAGLGPPGGNELGSAASTSSNHQRPPAITCIHPAIHPALPALAAAAGWSTQSPGSTRRSARWPVSCWGEFTTIR